MESKNPIIIDGLSCDNCPDIQRCKEQQAKKEYAINQVLQDIPSEYDNVISRLKQIIPSITRCDYVLEKQLARKEKENQKYEQALIVIEDILKEPIPYLNIDESKTTTEIEYDYAGKICVLEQRINKILQKINEVLD